jgi:hypothetical protein
VNLYLSVLFRYSYQDKKAEAGTMIQNLQELQLQQVITAIGGLGTAAFGLVDAAKSAFPGINRIGFAHIRSVVFDLTPEGATAGTPMNALPRANILESLEANWANGTDLASQKAIAKSLVKLHLSPGSAPVVAAKTSVDPAVLTTVATSMVNGTPLSQAETNALARLDLIVTALLDEAYQLSDQVYRNRTRALAALTSVALAVLGGWTLMGTSQFWDWKDPLLAILVGLLATPLAPIAKDLSTALATAVNTMQLVKKQGQ